MNVQCATFRIKICKVCYELWGVKRLTNYHPRMPLSRSFARSMPKTHFPMDLVGHPRKRRYHGLLCTKLLSWEESNRRQNVSDTADANQFSIFVNTGPTPASRSVWVLDQIDSFVEFVSFCDFFEGSVARYLNNCLRPLPAVFFYKRRRKVMDTGDTLLKPLQSKNEFCYFTQASGRPRSGELHTWLLVQMKYCRAQACSLTR